MKSSTGIYVFQQTILSSFTPFFIFFISFFFASRRREPSGFFPYIFFNNFFYIFFSILFKFFSSMSIFFLSLGLIAINLEWKKISWSIFICRFWKWCCILFFNLVVWKLYFFFYEWVWVEFLMKRSHTRDLTNSNYYWRHCVYRVCAQHCLRTVNICKPFASIYTI